MWSGPARAAESGVDCRPQGPLQSVSLKRVIDGDSIAVRNGEPLRLIGINTPELGRGDLPDEPGAAEALQALQALLAGRQRIWLAQDRERYDRYGRQLAHVYADPAEPPVAEQLLRQGLGWRVAVPPNLALQDCLAAAEDEARHRGRGLWASLPGSGGTPRPVSAPVPVAELDSAGFARIDLTIRKTVATARGWWLETEGPLVLQLDRADLVYFAEPRGEISPVPAASAGVEPESWRGQRWRVRGWVVDRSQSAAVTRHGHAPLLLRLRHPAMIERRVSAGE